ncbi:type IV pilus biogenesis protein PilP [Methylovorus glucosotrophus]|uniref:Type IV pilus biogenesis protein PilP n=1 Tax=Methylovorus glucosotrophus (strain SIP3-4) TaxID=582744 RepID=C6XET1_METGS|nr:type IV pilus biogenesis protein PilP [Methylovorus glucosotrophus]ACT52138.1 type IV pilus biogenesis protein PilP [Methylovorus glucosotrophus SIP3-4]
MYNRKLLIIALLSSISSPCFADKTSDEILGINEQIAILNARLGKAEAEVKLANKNQELQKLSGSSLDGDDLPVVRSIEGVDGRLLATLAGSGGITQTVGKGGKFGVWTVKSINVNSVTLVRGQKVVTLGFGSEPAAAATSYNNPALPR